MDAEAKSRKYTRHMPTFEELEHSGPRLHRYPKGLYVIQYAGINKRGRKTGLAKKLGIRTPEEAERALEIFKKRHPAPANGEDGASPLTLRTVVAFKRERRVQQVRRDPSKAILGMVAAHLLNTLAHTVKLLQEADEEKPPD